MKAKILAVSALGAFALGAAEVEDVIVRQQWPWSTDVKVEYKLSGVDGTHPVDITARAFNGDEELDAAALAGAITGDRYGITDSVGSFTIDPVKAFGTSRVALGSFRVKLSLSESAANLDEVIYKIFCLTNNTCRDVTRREILNGELGSYETDYGRIGDGFNTTLDDVLIWTAVTNDVKYKTTHLVMRKIPAAGVTWKIGAPSTEKGTDYVDNKGREDQHAVQLTEDFFIGVFELTQYQFSKFYTLPASGFTGETDSGIRPAVSVQYGYDLRGLNDWKAEDGSISKNEFVYWPTNAYRHAVRYNRAIGVMRSRLGTKFDLPTEAQWEFAYRAGSTNALYSGKEMITTAAERDRNVDELAWTKESDYSDAPGGTAQTRPVGLKKPNAFGLYDMAGNASEWCLDWFYPDVSTFYDEAESGMADVAHNDPLVDPVGRSTRSDTYNLRAVRGGNWNIPQRYTRAAYRFGQQYTASPNTTGLRVVCPAAADWK